MLGEAGPQSEIERLTAAAIQARQRADAGDLTIARTVLEAALTGGELRLGHDHPELVPLLVDLAMIAEQMGECDEARQRLGRAYAIMVAEDGPEHPTVRLIEERLSALGRPAIVPTGLNWSAAESPWAPPDPPPGRTQRIGRHAAPEPDPPSPSSPAPSNELWPAEDPAPAAPVDDIDAAHGYIASPASPGVYDRLVDEADLAGQASPDEGSQIAVAPGPGGALPVPRPSTRDGEGRRSRGRATGLVAAVVMGAAVLLAGTSAAVRALGAPSPRSDAPVPTGPVATVAPPTPTAAAAIDDPPNELSVTDDGGSVTLTWRDPTDGTAPFIVAGGRVDATATALQTVPAGRTRSVIYGLNSKHDYCFTVTVIYSTAVVASSTRVCTHRLSTVNGA